MTDSRFENDTDRAYIEELVLKYNADKDDPTITSSERALLNKASELESEISELRKQMAELQEQLKHKQSQTMAFIDSLIALKNAE